MRRSDAAFILSWFGVSRLLAIAAGIEPDSSLPELFWQLLPFDLLEERLGESLWYLHGQPPLYNLFVGLLLKLPGDAALWWRFAWVACGAGFPLLVFGCLSRAGFPRVPAHLFTLAAGLNPTLLLYENLLFYTYPEALCVLAGLWALLPGGRGQPAWGAFAFTSSILVLFRAMFQPVWSAGVAVAVLTGLPRVDRRAVSGVGASLLIGMLLVVKNGVMFDVWTTSSWYGQNVAKLMGMAMLGEAPRLAEAGVVSPVFVTGPFVAVRQYPADLVDGAVARTEARHGRVPALVVEAKRNHSPNFNHVAYIDVSRQLAADSLAAYRARPWLVHEAVAKGVVQFLQPASSYSMLDHNWRRVRPVDDIYLKVLYPRDGVWLPAVALVFATLSSFAIWLFGTGRFKPLRAAAGYVLVTVVWVSVTGNLAEFGENARFRFTIDPLIVTWIGVLAGRAFGGRAASTIWPTPPQAPGARLV